MHSSVMKNVYPYNMLIQHLSKTKPTSAEYDTVTLRYGRDDLI